jgi:hypothetical protein
MADTPASGPTTWLTEKLSSFMNGSDAMTTPDVTKVQALAIAQAFIAVLVVLGIDLDQNVQQAIIALSVVLGAVLPLSDAAIRRRRTEYADKIVDARQTLAGTQAAGANTADDAGRRALERAELKLAEARRAAAG